MLRLEDDPRFEQLKADIQEAREEVVRGEVFTHEQVWEHVRETIERVAMEQREERIGKKHQPNEDN